MKDILITGGLVINEGEKNVQDILVQNGRIEKLEIIFPLLHPVKS